MQCEVPLAPLTTFELGGRARFFLEATREAEVGEALAWAEREALPLAVLGGGSNVVVADEGFAGLVIRMATRGIHARCETPGEPILVSAAAGETWDDLVARAAGEGWAGIECLSGIPGTVGATPIQNVGAYGQEVAQTIVSVRVLDRGHSGHLASAVDSLPTSRGSTTSLARELSAAACGFGYRDSVFRQEPGRFVVLAVTFALIPGGAAAVRYPELARALGDPVAPPGLTAVRQAVIELRRTKSMVLDPADPNRRSAGSFFTNPVLSAAEAATVADRATRAGVIPGPEAMPAYPTAGGAVKLSAAWLIERAGFPRGTGTDRFGISSRHTLALVHRGGGTARELVAFARAVHQGVADRFGVHLKPEPVFLGFPTADPLA